MAAVANNIAAILLKFSAKLLPNNAHRRTYKCRIETITSIANFSAVNCFDSIVSREAGTGDPNRHGIFGMSNISHCIPARPKEIQLLHSRLVCIIILATHMDVFQLTIDCSGVVSILRRAVKV